MSKPRASPGRLDMSVGASQSESYPGIRVILSPGFPQVANGRIPIFLPQFQQAKLGICRRIRGILRKGRIKGRASSASFPCLT